MNVICILGMHRSGTSCLTGSLQKAGLYLGHHSTWNPHNQHGNRENPRINRLHFDLVDTSGGDWDDPPETVRWRPYHEMWACELIEAYPKDRPWGFKDPMTLLALDGWKRLIGPMRHIGIFRHPAAVARSITKRSNNKISIERGIALWKYYNTLLLKEFQKYPFPLLCFDWDEDTFHRRLNRVLPELGLVDLISDDDRFYTAELHNHITEDAAEAVTLPPEVENLYQKLQSLAV